MEHPSRVTITLGRKGQVVKKAAVSTDFSFADSQSSVGNKRSVKDRLGAVGGSTSQLSSKRQRGDVSGWSNSAYSGVDDASLDKDDLRFKILRKSGKQGNDKQNAVDLRDLLSRSAQSSTGPTNTRPHIPEPKDMRLHHHHHHIDPQNNRQQMIEGRDARQLRPPMPDPRDSRPLMSEPKDVRYPMAEPRSAEILRQTPARNVDSPLVGSRASYSPWTLERLRRKSPEGISSSRGTSPPIRGDELQRRPPVRPYDDPRLHSLSSKDFPPFSRPMSSTYLANPAPPARTMVPPLHPPIPPPSSLVQKTPYPIEDAPTMDGFLHSLGLDKYAINFKAEEVDMHALRQMGDNDLKELGIPMGPRKKIMLALSRAKRHP